MRRLFTPGKLALAGGVLAAATIAILIAVPADGSYIFLPDEPHLVEPLIQVADRPPPTGPGGIYFVDVIVRQPSLFERLFPSIHDGASIVPAEAVNPTGVSEQQRRRSSLQVMSRSQQIAAAVALREAGYDVEAEPLGAFVAQVLPDTPAAGEVQVSDVIVEVDGRPVRTLEDLRDRLATKRPGQEVELTVLRGEERVPVDLELAAAPGDPGRAVIGVIVEQEVDVDLPLDVEIDADDVGGPSAGLAFALGILEELGRDVDHGRRVAVTGELQLDGSVTSVGGLEQKTVAAREDGVDAFLVPAGENAEEARRHADGLRIVPVRNFQQALRALATLPPVPQE